MNAPGARRAGSSAAMSSDGAKLVRAARVGDDAKVKRLLKAMTLDVDYVDDVEGKTNMGDHDRGACEAAARARDAEAFKGGMTVKEINAAFGERAGELKKPAKRDGLIDMGLIHSFMM